jgi:hypothetical protein
MGCRRRDKMRCKWRRSRKKIKLVYTCSSQITNLCNETTMVCLEREGANGGEGVEEGDIEGKETERRYFKEVKGCKWI